MIPYFEFGPLFTVPFINREVHAFGLLVVAGIITGTNVAFWKARQMKLDAEKLSSMITFMLITGFVMAHWFDNLAYRFDEVIKNPIMLLHFWSGISSYGGFIGAFLGIWYYVRKHKLNFFEYAEPIAYGLPFGWFFGRMGCAVVHDHIGAKTDFVLAINFPELGPRHDLGLYEAIFALFLCFLFIGLRNKKYPAGTYLMILCLMYAPVRFLLDSLRATDIAAPDARFLSLTPAQYTSILTLLAGIYLYRRIFIARNTQSLPVENV